MEADMTYETIIVKQENNITKITINRPDAMNSLSPTLVRELNAAFDDIEGDNTTKVVVLTGAGRAFCAGGDLQSMSDPNMGSIASRDFVHGAGKVAYKMINLQKPVISAVNGDAVGAGFGLALAADIVIASQKARFGAIFVRVGLVPDTGLSYTLPRIVGQAKAKELCWAGDIIDAAEAQRLGIVTKIVPAEQLESEAIGLANKLAIGPSRSMGLTKMIMNKSIALGNLDAIIEYEAEAQALCFQDEDFKEGIKAFREKRQPKFKGV
jgi:2-(1,2-epoxy-1,2-dihydrophenyl)acetyl-CoA isomerase